MFESEIAVLLIGAAVSALVQLAKKYGANPLVVLGCLSVGVAGAWAAITNIYGPDVVEAIASLAVQIAGMASLLYNILKSFVPQVKSENMDIK